MRGGLLRRPQRPSSHAPKRARKLSSGAPSRTAGNRQLCRNPSQAIAHLTRALPSTLLESTARRNWEFPFPCAETVDDGNCLWKGKEKPDKILERIPPLRKAPAQVPVRATPWAALDPCAISAYEAQNVRPCSARSKLDRLSVGFWPANPPRGVDAEGCIPADRARKIYRRGPLPLRAMSHPAGRKWPTGTRPLAGGGCRVVETG